MAINELLEQLEEHDVPQDVIDGLKAEFDSSGLRKKIGEYEQRWKDEAEPAIAFKARHETLPKRKEALKRVGVDYDAVPKYGQKALDNIPAEDLNDLEKLAGHVQAEGFEANIEAEQEGTEKSGAEVITDFATSQTGTPPAPESYEAAIKAAKSPEDLDAVYKRFGKEPVSS